MLPGLVAKTRETLESEDTPITPRKRLMNFKIPLVNRGNQRRDAVIVSRRRLYEEENDSDSRKGRRKRRRSRDRSPKTHDQHKRQHSKNHLHVAVLSDISSDELYSDEERKEPKKARKVIFLHYTNIIVNTYQPGYHKVVKHSHSCNNLVII